MMCVTNVEKVSVLNRSLGGGRGGGSDSEDLSYGGSDSEDLSY